MKRTDDNYFTISGLGEIKFPKRFRLTSISGEQLVSTVPGIRNNENILTDIQYSGFNPGGFSWWIRMSSNFPRAVWDKQIKPAHIWSKREMAYSAWEKQMVQSLRPDYKANFIPG